MRRFVVAGRLLEGTASLIVNAEDAEQAEARARGVGLDVTEVCGANRRMAREQHIYGPNRRAPRLMTVPRGRR